MGHRWNCPTPWTAEREGERAFERGEGYWRNPYRDDGWGRSRCEDADRAWQRGYRDAERREEERQAERRAEERRREEARWRQQEQEQYDEQMRAEEEAYWETEQRLDAEYGAAVFEAMEAGSGNT